jgi:hypothetical protein
MGGVPTGVQIAAHSCGTRTRGSTRASIRSAGSPIMSEEIWARLQQAVLAERGVAVRKVGNIILQPLPKLHLKTRVKMITT